MVLLIESIAVIILLICLWVGINYVMLTISKYNADKAFKIIYDSLKIQYKYVDLLLVQNPALSFDANKLIDDTKVLITQAMNFSIEKDGNERIIAYANTILENAKFVINEFIKNGYTNFDLQNYADLQKDFNKQKDEYNTAAQKLKRYVDIFPSSFIARLKLIETMDYLTQ